MEIKTSGNFCILTPLSIKIDKIETEKIANELNLHSNMQIGIDLSFVRDCTFDFVNMLYNISDIALFNIPSDIFSILNAMNMDKKLNLFVNEWDFLSNKHRLLNRKFSLV